VDSTGWHAVKTSRRRSSSNGSSTAGSSIWCGPSSAAREFLDLALVDVRPAQPVDAAVLGGGHEPGARVSRDARLRPLLQGGDERLLGEVLGEADVTHQAGRTRDEPWCLDPPHGLDRASDVGIAHY
jgi:hypothetical protein